MNVFLYIMASRASCSLKQKSCEKETCRRESLSHSILKRLCVCVCLLKRVCVCRAGLRTACAVLLLVTITCLLALLSVNSDMILFHYLFAGFCCAQVTWAQQCASNHSEHLTLVMMIVCVCLCFRGRSFSSSVWCLIKKREMPCATACGKKRPDHMIKSKPSVSLQTVKVLAHWVWNVRIYFLTCENFGRNFEFSVQ